MVKYIKFECIKIIDEWLGKLYIIGYIDSKIRTWLVFLLDYNETCKDERKV